MSVIKGTENNFEQEVLQSDKPVLVDFNADWCGPCRMMAPVLEALSEEYDGAKFVSVNVDDEGELAEEYEVFSIPCLVAFKNGEETQRTVGVCSKEELIRLLEAE